MPLTKITDPDIQAINSIEDAIKYFENKGISLTEDEKAIFYSELLTKEFEGAKKCKISFCLNGVKCSWKNYCDYHSEQQEQLKSLVQQKVSISDPQEVIRFETWWNNNLATVVSGNHPYTIWLIIYEPAERNKSEILWKFEISQGYDKRSAVSVKNKVASIRNELNGENPILAINPHSDSSLSFSELVKESYVKKVDLPFKPSKREYDDDALIFESSFIHTSGEYPSNPQDYLKPLDIVKVKKSVAANSYYHLGIYLGNNQVCHFSDPYSKKSTDDMRIRVTSWDTFMRGWEEEFLGSIVGIHPVIPFRNYGVIAKNIAWDETNNYGCGKYCLANNNCEHYVNSRIFNLNWSEQAAERSSEARKNAHRQGIWDYGSKCYECRQGRVNNGKSGNFYLRDELSNYLSQTDNYRSQEVKRRYLQEVPPKDNNCRIM